MRTTMHKLSGCRIRCDSLFWARALPRFTRLHQIILKMIEWRQYPRILNHLLKMKSLLHRLILNGAPVGATFYQKDVENQFELRRSDIFPSNAAKSKPSVFSFSCSIFRYVVGIAYWCDWTFMKLTATIQTSYKNWRFARMSFSILTEKSFIIPENDLWCFISLLRSSWLDWNL